MNYLITGGAGFIGSHLCDHLVQAGHQITVIDDFNDFYDPAIKKANLKSIQDDIQLIEADIRDELILERIFKENRFDGVVHLAARAGVRPSIQDPKLYLSTNIDGTFYLLDCCKKHDVGVFTMASSSSVYGVNEKVPFAESDLISRTISPYAATKLMGEQLCSNYAALYGIRTACLRFFTVYGPRQRPDLAIAKFTHRISNGLPIDQFGDGSTARDYTYIDDIISGVLAAMNHTSSNFDIFNLGGSATTKLSELISSLESLIGRKAIINYLPEQPGDVPRTYADTRKAESLLNYRATTPIQEGLAKYVTWYQSEATAS